MPPDLVFLLPLGFAALLVIAALYDFFQRRIPNWTVVALLLLFVPCAWMGLTPAGWSSSLAAFALALFGTGGLYLLGWLGPGDSKLFAASALFAGLSNLIVFCAATAVAGGLYALGVLFLRPKQVLRGMTSANRADGALRGIPYGVAIAAGALITAATSHFLKPHVSI